ncbi:MAG: DUF934 domain-containing protein [Gammaproteobacteria bacterium]|nr:DUF934 domain-containing protein [Gammaproteobacteria bacterium]
MSILVTDSGFSTDDWLGQIEEYDESIDSGPAVAIDLPSHVDPSSLTNHLDTLQLIRVDFPSFSDGRGFTVARLIRLMGYQGRLRAVGHLIADQYAMARRSGFDEVEISAELAARQPAHQWLFRADWRAHDYQTRLSQSI